MRASMRERIDSERGRRGSEGVVGMQLEHSEMDAEDTSGERGSDLYGYKWGRSRDVICEITEIA